MFLITLGTGTGSALFYNGMLVPNLELGHMEIRGRDAERVPPRPRGSGAACPGRHGPPTSTSTCWRSSDLFWPNLFIIGGGVSKRADQFVPRLTIRAGW